MLRILLCFAIILFLICKANKKDNAEKEEQALKLIIKQSKVKPLVEKWVQLTRKNNERREIQEWRFCEKTDNHIYVRFKDDPETEVYGKLTYKFDDFPRVSSFSYKTEAGVRKQMGGYPVPKHSLDVLISSYRMQKNDPRRLALLNSVSEEALLNDVAYLDICEYQGISEDDFYKIMGKREIEALKTVIEENLKVTGIEGSSFICRMPDVPIE